MTLTDLLLLLTPLWPLLLALPLAGSLLKPVQVSQPYNLLWLSAPLPALLLAITATGDPATTQLQLDWLLLGSLWWLDDVRRVFLLVTALLWLLAGLHARGYVKPSRSFALFWLLAQSGNLLLILAEDIASFYLGFAAMTFAAYGLVIHQGSPEARTAGRVYLVLAVLGEGLMLAGLLGTAARSGATTLAQLATTLSQPESPGWLVTCLLLGFGVKAGLPALHVWLPLAHPVAPAPASAVLSGAMIKAGLLGWWLTLPLGLTSLPDAGQWLSNAGLVAALAAALIGLMQAKAKTVLAYSSISQMGMITALLGAGLANQQLWLLLVPALLLFVAHHGLNKGSLFLAVSLVEKKTPLPRPLLGLLLLLPALALTGLLASGTLTKNHFKAALYQEDATTLIGWLTLAAVGTTLLMARYLWLLWQQQQQLTAGTATASPWMLAGWLLLLPLGLLVPWWLPLPAATHPGWPDLQHFMQLALPVLAGTLLASGGGWLVLRLLPDWSSRALPAGDLLFVYCWLIEQLALAGRRLLTGLQPLQQKGLQWLARLLNIWPWLLWLTNHETGLRREAALTFTFLLVLLLVLLLL